MRQQIRGRAQRGILRSKVTIAFLIVTGTTLTRPSTANAQDPLTLTEVVKDGKQAYDFLKGAYDFYQSNFTWQDPVVTASMLNAAVKQLSDLMIGLASQTYVDQVQTAISDYNYAVACVGTGSDCATKWQNFDQEAGLLLSTIATKIKSDPNYSHLLGIAYNLLVPVYLQSHPNGAKWGILATNKSGKLMDDFMDMGKTAFDINFLMVGASSITFPSSFTGKSPYPHTPNSSTTYDTRTKSQLFSYIKAADTHSCYGSDDVCVAYLQTDPTAQVAQRAMLTLYDMFKDSYSNFTYTADGTRQTVIVDVAASYQHNWQDYNNAVWTAMFPPTSTAEAALNRCQDGSAVVGIWSNPKNWNMAFLCQSIPGYPAWITGTSTPLEQNWNPSCGAGGLCGYFLSCSGSDFLVGGPTGSEINCYHREDGSTILPQKGSCDSTDHTYSNMPAQGSFFALPTGTYLTGYYMGNYMNNKYAAYSYCSATVSSGSLGAAMSMGVVGGLPFPNYFNVFTFGNISGIRDVQGAVAAGGSIDANSFNINSANGSMGLVSTGLLKLVNGTVGGGIIYASGEDFTGVTYQTFANQAGKPLDIVTGKAMDFQDARTRLQAMSKNVSGLVANGSTNIAYGNITLKSKDPTLNIFLVSAADLKATHSIVVDVPTTSTLIINVSGANVSITNAGITVFVGANRILWNLYEATQFYSNSVYINGSILAPFARANTGGSINGTLIAETAESASEFYKAPFLNNWLVP